MMDEREIEVHEYHDRATGKISVTLVGSGVEFETFWHLARLGLWAKQHGIPIANYYSMIHQYLEQQRIISGAPAREALAALPKEKE